MARGIGVEGRGYFVIITFIIALGLQFSSLGIQTLNIYKISQNRALASVMASNSVILGASLGFTASLIIFIIDSLDFYNFGLTQPLLLLALVSIPLALIYQFLVNIYLAKLEISKFNILEILSKLIPAFLICMSILIFKDNIFIIGLAVWVSYLVMSTFVIWDQKIFPSLSIDLSIPYQNFFYGFKGYIAQLVSFAQQRITILLVQSYYGISELGIYSISLMLFDFLIMIPTTIGMLAFPYFSQESERVGKILLLKNVILLVAVIALLIIIITYFVSEYIILFAFGNGFAQASIYLLYLLPGVIFASLNTIYMNYLASEEMPLVTVYAPLVSFIVSVVTFILLHESYGVLSAAIATSLSYFILNLITSMYLLKTVEK
jgi:O-antigen/teichoic acid export membrane protein